MYGSYKQATLTCKDDFFIQINQDERMQKIFSKIQAEIENEAGISIFSIRYNKFSVSSEQADLEIYLKTTQDYDSFVMNYKELEEYSGKLISNNKFEKQFLDLVKQYKLDELCSGSLKTFYHDFEHIAKKHTIYETVWTYNYESEKIQALNEKNGLKKRRLRYKTDLNNNYNSSEPKVYLVFRKKKDYEKWVGTEIIQEIKQEVYEKLKEADVYDYIREEDYEFYVNLSPQGVGQYYFELEENLKTAVKV